MECDDDVEMDIPDSSNTMTNDGAANADESNGEPVDYDEHPDDSDKGEWTQVTRSGRNVFKSQRKLYEVTNFSVEETNYYQALADHDEFDEEEV